jgi:hypothetical protein
MLSALTECTKVGLSRGSVLMLVGSEFLVRVVDLRADKGSSWIQSIPMLVRTLEVARAGSDGLSDFGVSFRIPLSPKFFSPTLPGEEVRVGEGVLLFGELDEVAIFGFCLDDEGVRGILIPLEDLPSSSLVRASRFEGMLGLRVRLFFKEESASWISQAIPASSRGSGLTGLPESRT